MKRAFLLTLLSFVLVGCVGTSTPEPTIAPTQTPYVVVEVQKVPVTQVVEVTRQVEVTRVVTQVITATPEPTLTPTMTPEPAFTATPQPPSMESILLDQLKSLRYEIEAMNIDERMVMCGRGYEDSLTDHYESIIDYPEYDISNASSLAQKAYAEYRQSIGIIEATNRDLYIFCIDLLEKDQNRESISHLTASVARQGINDALGLILPAIDSLQK